MRWQVTAKSWPHATESLSGRRASVSSNIAKHTRLHLHYLQLANAVCRHSDRQLHVLQAVIQEPVTVGDGHTYQRSAIEEWVSKYTFSPMTGEELMTLEGKVLVIPNHTFKALAAQLGLVAPLGDQQ